MTDLSERYNPSRWASLLDMALPLVDTVFYSRDIDPARPDWTLGGGTAIALRLAHRTSHDIDLFVGSADLRLFTPMKNRAAADLKAVMQFPGNYLKFLKPEGEIDFLPGPLLTSPGFTMERFRGRSIALQTIEEVVIKKVRYRATSFKPRDIFDLAVAAANCGSLGATMKAEVADRLPTLLTAIRRQDASSFKKAAIVPLDGYESLVETAIERAGRFVAGLVPSKSA